MATYVVTFTTTFSKSVEASDAESARKVAYDEYLASTPEAKLSLLEDCLETDAELESK
jgi:hypothetical protein